MQLDWPCKKSQVVNLNLIKAYYSITRVLYILFSLQLQSPPILTSLTVTGINIKNGKSAKTLGMVQINNSLHLFQDDRTNNSSVSQQLDDLHISDKNTQCEPSCSQTETRGNGKYCKTKVSFIPVNNYSQWLINHSTQANRVSLSVRWGWQDEKIMGTTLNLTGLGHALLEDCVTY